VYLRKEWASLLIAVSQGLALLPSLGILGFSRLFRVIRPAILIWRFLAIGTAGASEIRALLKRRAVATAFAVAGFVWISAAVAFTIAEDVGTDGRIDSFGDALWWSATTISTVGYGDIYPMTTVGRVVAVLTTVVGVSTFGVVTAKLASVLIRESNSNP
jgi:voltage-gated potassium channel